MAAPFRTGRLVALIAVVAVGAGIGSVAYVAGRGGTPTASPVATTTSPPASPSPSPAPLPEVHLRLLRSDWIATFLPAGSRAIRHRRFIRGRRTAGIAIRHIRGAVNTLYTEAFLRNDPAALLDRFTTRARPVARQHLHALSADGAEVQPLGGTVRVTVLLDRSGHPTTATANVRFRAQEGDTIVVSIGHFFLQPSSRGWIVSAFVVRRTDHPATTAASPSWSPLPTA